MGRVPFDDDRQIKMGDAKLREYRSLERTQIGPANSKANANDVDPRASLVNVRFFFSAHARLFKAISQKSTRVPDLFLFNTQTGILRSFTLVTLNAGDTRI